MVIAWIGYCLLTSALLGLAAFAAERALGHYRKPVRGVWVAALAGSLLLPVAAYVVPALVAHLSPMPQGIPISVASLSGLAVESAGAGEAAGFDWAAAASAAGTLIAWLWGVSVLALSGYLIGSYRGLKREMEGWTPGKVLGAPVMMSRTRGPAVVGIRRGVIVMPTWIADLEEELLRLVFLHEREHQRAGDQRWFALGLFAAIAMPWNPIVWWQLHRLRLAIEYDCDRRVIERGVSRREYAEALLAVGSRVSEAPFAAAAFTERKPAVERRLRRMTDPLRRLRGPRAALAGGVGTLALILACGSQPPTASDDQASSVYAVVERAMPDEASPYKNLPPPPAGGSASDRPSFLPYDKPPTLANRGEVMNRLQRYYPRNLWDAGIGGRVELWLHIDEQGEVAGYQIKTSSGNPRFDDAAKRVAESMRFTPALNRDQPTPVWVSQWFTFEVDPPASTPLLREGRGGPDRPRGEVTVRGEPLIVIDGVIQNESFTLEDASPDDIDHIEIIKGTAAVSLYGERGRNGVIRITTKEAAAEDGPPMPAAAGRPDRDAARTIVETIEAHPALGDAWRDVPVSERPLMVVDGVIQNGLPSLDELGLSESDIEHIDFVRGPLAEHAYGERGRNGVIDVTTKSSAASGSGR